MSRSAQALIVVLALAAGIVAGHVGRNAPKPGPLELALDSPDRRFRASSVAAAMATLDRDNVGEVISVFDQNLATLDETELQMLGEGWARLDPHFALEHVLAWPLEAKGETAAIAIVGHWTDVAPDDAKREILSLPEGPTRRKLVRTLVSKWAIALSPEVIDFVASLPPSRERILLSNSLVGVWHKMAGAEVTKTWIESLASGSEAELDFKSTVFEQACRLLASQDPIATRAWMSDLQEEPYAAEGAGAVAVGWARIDGVSALDWVSSWPESDSRGAALEQSFRRWWSLYPENAEHWLAGQQAAEGFDPARRALSRALAKTDRRRARAWATKIQDPEMRAQELRRFRNAQTVDGMPPVSAAP